LSERSWSRVSRDTVCGTLHTKQVMILLKTLERFDSVSREKVCGTLGVGLRGSARVRKLYDAP